VTALAAAAGAVGQLERLQLVPVYVREANAPGLLALRQKGALAWQEPSTGEELEELLAADVRPYAKTDELPLSAVREDVGVYDASTEVEVRCRASQTEDQTPSGALFASVRSLMAGLIEPLSVAEIAVEFDVSRAQVEAWLKRLLEAGSIEKLSKPVRYRTARTADSQGSLFGGDARLDPLPDEDHENTEKSQPQSPEVAGSQHHRDQAAAKVLLTTVRAVVADTTVPQSAAEIAVTLDVSAKQAAKWLNRLVEAGVLEKLAKPVRYRRPTRESAQTSLFER